MHDRRDAAPLRWGPFALDLRARELRRDGQRIRLQDKPLELLVALVERPGEVVTREELRSRLWPADTFVAFDDSLNTAVSKLREALGDSADGPRLVETVPRRGYRFIGPIEGGGVAVVSRLPEPPTIGIARRPAFAVLLALVALASGGAVAWLFLRSPMVAPALVRLEIRAPEGTQFPSGNPDVTVSPDGRQIAFRAVLPPRLVQIWVQSIDGSARRPLPGTEGAEDFAWSPDGGSIAFRKPEGELVRHDMAQGLNVRLAGGLGHAVGMSWHDEAGILIGGGPGHGLSRVSAHGGTPSAVTTLDAEREETMHAWPQFLDDGRSFIYLALSRSPENSGIYLARLGGPARRLLLAGNHKAMVAAPGILVYLQRNRLVARRFDADRAALLGEPVEVGRNLAGFGADGAVAFSASSPDALAYAPPRRLPSREMIWLTRAGQRMVDFGPPNPDMSFSLSPDGRWTVFERHTPGIHLHNPELWLLDIARRVTLRVTDNPGNDEGAAWSPDSRRFAYARHRGIQQPSDLYVKDVSDPEAEHPLLVDDTGSKHPFDWSVDGRFILYSVSSPGMPEDIWVLPLGAGHPPYPWLVTRFRERGARFSPDGRWVAYESDESGANEIYVRAFDDPRARWQVSTNGGMSPQWRRDGRELYYTSGDHNMTAVAIRSEKGFDPGKPQPLFELRRLSPNPRWRTPYAVSADGQRFLVGALTDEGGDSPITVVLNWRRLLER